MGERRIGWRGFGDVASVGSSPAGLLRPARLALLALPALIAPLAPACGEVEERPEPGAVLLEITLAPGTSEPDELRVSVYDASGALWKDVRLPEQRPLGAAGNRRLGTVLIQPGSSSEGDLRVHVRALRLGALAGEGVLVVALEARGRRAVALALDPAVLRDADGDGVPDEIDDCAAEPNPAQGGCSTVPEEHPDAGSTADAAPPEDGGSGGVGATGSGGAGGGGNDAGIGGAGGASGDAGRDANTGGSGGAGGSDAGGGGAGGSGAGGGDAGGGDAVPRRANGESCAVATDCASELCADGVCCNDTCSGACRSCNQPGRSGTCAPYADGSDPERECSAGAACNGAGACAPLPAQKQNGEACGTASECRSGFCVDGACCENACNQECRTCVTGSCLTVTRAEDVPECAAPRSCNRQGRCVNE
jgi:hypothetical protein